MAAEAASLMRSIKGKAANSCAPGKQQQREPTLCFAASTMSLRRNCSFSRSSSITMSLRAGRAGAAE